MGAAAPYQNAFSSPLNLTYHHLANKLNFPTHVPFLMRLPTDLAFRHISANVNFNKRFQDLRVDIHRKHMATNNNQEKNITKQEEAQKESKELIPPPPPPPPEKPEPGDCCGSGCVRCVWDVYYEELEAYNKLYKSDSQSTNSKSN